MNAAFLLVTSAMVVGQAGAKPAAPAPAAPAVASSCGHDCGCDGFGHRFRDRFRGLFSRNNDCCPTTTTCCESRTRTRFFHSRCEDACRPKLFNWNCGCHQPKCQPACAPARCDDCCARTSFLDRLRGAFSRNRCCDSGCTSAAPVTSEKITPPKVMPKGGKKTSQDVRIENQPAPFTPGVTTVPSTPSVEVVPVPTPRIEGARRDPF